MNTSHALPKRAAIIIAGLFLALAWTSPAFSAADKRANAEALTRSLVGLNTAYQKAAPSAKSQALRQLIDATVERQALLAELIETDPGAVLRIAIPARIRNGMPAEVQSFIEQRVEIEGELEVIFEDYTDGSYRLRHALKADGKRIALHFKSQPNGLLSGTPVQVSGVLIDKAMAVESGEEDILTLACCVDTNSGPEATSSTMPVLPNTLGEQRTLVMLVNFQDKPNEKPWTVNEYSNLVFGTASDFFLEASYGQTWLSGEVVGWYTVPLDSTTCDHNQLGNYANQAATAAGIDLSTYDRRIYAFPSNPNCRWSGKGTLGGKPTSSWSNGQYTLRVIAHELGHNLGLWHSNNLECGATTLGDNCISANYGDVLDIMGGGVGHYNAFQKDRLGWLGNGFSPLLTIVEASGSYDLEAYASYGTGPKALKMLKSVAPVSGEKTWYYVEYRRPVGFDVFLADYGDNVVNGVSVHTGSELNGNTSILLDMAPDNIWPDEADWEEPALVAGESFSDADAGVTIATVWTDNDGALVNVSIGPLPCIQTNPTLVVSPSESDWVEPGTTVIYTMTLTNNDTAACPASDFDLSANIPGGWAAAFAVSLLSLEPGASDTTTLEVISATSADGFYNITLTAMNRAAPVYVTTATVTYVAQPAPNNQAPTALDDEATTDQEIAVNIAVLSNDSDPDGDALELASITQGTNGSVTINPDGTLIYTPSGGFVGTDGFTYTIADGNSGSANARVIVTVIAEPSNQAPVAIADAVTILDKILVTIDVSANDSDPDGDSLTLIAVTQGTKGSVAINADQTLTYTPGKRFKNGDSFTYEISDGLASATATVTVTLQKQQGGKSRKPKR